MSKTFATLTVPPVVYLAVKDLLMDAGYTHAFVSLGKEGELIDMHGIALKMEKIRKEESDEPASTTD
jgi:hypothetical protein